MLPRLIGPTRTVPVAQKHYSEPGRSPRQIRPKESITMAAKKISAPVRRAPVAASKAAPKASAKAAPVAAKPPVKAAAPKAPVAVVAAPVAAPRGRKAMPVRTGNPAPSHVAPHAPAKAGNGPDLAGQLAKAMAVIDELSTRLEKATAKREVAKPATLAEIIASATPAATDWRAQFHGMRVTIKAFDYSKKGLQISETRTYPNAVLAMPSPADGGGKGDPQRALAMGLLAVHAISGPDGSLLDTPAYVDESEMTEILAFDVNGDAVQWEDATFEA
jgi:hypothetical protein